MANYPSIDQSIQSRRTPHSGLEVETADDGTVRGRRLYAATSYEFSVVHDFISTADKDSILSHYASNSTATFSFVWAADSATYNVNYLNEPDVQRTEGGYWIVTTPLRGLKV